MLPAPDPHPATLSPPVLGLRQGGSCRDMPSRVPPPSPPSFPGHGARHLAGLPAGTHRQKDTRDDEDENQGAPQPRPGTGGAPCPGARGGLCALSPLPRAAAGSSLSRSPRSDSRQSHQELKCASWGAGSSLPPARCAGQGSTV